MRVPRIYTPQPLTPRQEITVEAEASHHLSQVLRLKPEDAVIVFNGDGSEYSARIHQQVAKNTLIKLGGQLRKESTSTLKIHLIIAISRGERMDFALQKSVELGVYQIQPVFSKRCVVKLQGQRLNRRMAHWQQIIVHACEQSNRCWIPSLLPPAQYPDALVQAHTGCRLMLDHRSQINLSDIPRPDTAVSLLVGPEGGLTEDERELARREEFNGIKLGPRILRTETAPLAAMAAIQTLWGDFGENSPSSEET